MNKKGVFVGLQLVISIVIIFLVLIASKFMFGVQSSQGWVELYDTEKGATCSYLLYSLLNGEYMRAGAAYSTQLGYDLLNSQKFIGYQIASTFPPYYFSDIGQAVFVVSSVQDFKTVYSTYTYDGYNLFCSVPLFGPATNGYAMLWVKPS